MPSQKMLEKYAEVIVKVGVNLQKGQMLYISTLVETYDFARILAKAAYEAGASNVKVLYADEKLARLRYEYEDEKTLSFIPQFAVDEREFVLEQKGCYIGIACNDPEAYTGCDAKKVAIANKASSEKMHHFLSETMANTIRWNVMSIPTVSWAKKLFPDETDEVAVEKLWDLIFKAMRMYEDDPVAAWERHCAKTKKRIDFLNSNNFVSFRYTNSLGTDLTIGMMEDSVWGGADELAKDGVSFMANLPTEEVFSAPHRLSANGTLFSALPLNYRGSLIDNFSLTFKDGKVVSYTAKVGYDALGNLLATDEGSKYLGEIALVQYDSPISNLKTLFYNTLFDENASCHFALGAGYPNCTASGEKLSDSELLEHGLNQSLNHEDFMVGTADLDIVGTTKDGRKIQIFKNGNFAF